VPGFDDAKPESGGEGKRWRDAERTGKPFLHWRDRGRHEFQIRLLTSDRVTVGRRGEHDVLLADDEVSRLHAVLEHVGGDWVLVDQNSRNGSYINGSRVNTRQVLHDGDRMCFGRTYVGYRDPSTEPASKTTARAEDSHSGIRIEGTKRKVLIALCRPVQIDHSSTPATNPQIASDVHLTVDAVKAHLRELFERFNLSELPQNEKRAKLVQIVREEGLIEPWEY
jgi:FHA domain-containing protein